jgi:hypothetical protein
MYHFHQRKLGLNVGKIQWRLFFLDGLTIYTLSLIVDYNDETQDFVFQPIDLVLFVNDGHPERAREEESERQKKAIYIYIYTEPIVCAFPFFISSSATTI